MGIEISQLLVFLFAACLLCLAAIVVACQALSRAHAAHLAVAQATLVARRPGCTTGGALPSPETDSGHNSKKGKEVSGEVTRFLIDSLVLRKSFDYVCDKSPGKTVGANGMFREVFHYATGLNLGDNRYAISHIVPVEFAHQSVGGVRVADESSIEKLAWLDELGLPLVCHVHSHPGCGVGATYPSTIDMRFQERLQRGGHIAVGLIFSRDGFARFFGGEGQEFDVDVQGHQVEKEGDNVYRLAMAQPDIPSGPVGW